jgi:NHL repeat
VKRSVLYVGRLAAVAAAVLVCGQPAARLRAQGPSAPANPNPPIIKYDEVDHFLKYSPDMNLGEVLGVTVNSKGHLVVLNHPGSSTNGPLYGNASTQLLEFDEKGNFVREIGKGVYGLGYGHSVRFDRHDNLWVVDKGTHAATRFDPAGYVTLNLGRRPEGPDEPEYFGAGRGGPPARAIDGYFRGPTDVTWDSQDNIYISDGYTNSRVAKFDKWGNWVTQWGQRGTGGPHADENPGNFNTPHNIASDRADNIYVADRNNRRIQVFRPDGTFVRFLLLNAPYDKARHPVLGNATPNAPDETQPWTLCITNGPTQYIYTSDSEPGRIYKMTLDGTIVGMFGESGRGPGQFNWVHALACPSENELIVADMNNWRVKKLILHP